MISLIRWKYIAAVCGCTVLGMIMSSCGRKLVNDANTYVQYLDEPGNGLVQQHTAEHIRFVAACRPPAYLAIKELGPRLDAGSLQKRAGEMSDNLVFTFRIMSEDGNQDAVRGQVSPQQYLARISHMTGPIQNDFFLVQGTDTVPCAFSHFERAYNVTPYNEILLGFESGLDDGKDKVLLYRDQLFGLGYLRFPFSASDIKRIPQLTL